MTDLTILPIESIQKRIFTFRDLPVMIDSDLAELYGVETKVLNQAVKRNISRFPSHFRFQLTMEEKEELVTNCDRFEKMKYSSVLPHAFSEQGVSMLSAVLKSETAVKVSIQIMDAFVDMRKFISGNAGLFHRSISPGSSLSVFEGQLLTPNEMFYSIYQHFLSKVSICISEEYKVGNLERNSRNGEVF